MCIFFEKKLYFLLWLSSAHILTRQFSQPVQHPILRFARFEIYFEILLRCKTYHKKNYIKKNWYFIDKKCVLELLLHIKFYRVILQKRVNNNLALFRIVHTVMRIWRLYIRFLRLSPTTLLALPACVIWSRDFACSVNVCIGSLRHFEIVLNSEVVLGPAS